MIEVLSLFKNDKFTQKMRWLNMDDLYRLKTQLNEYWMDYDDGSCADKISIPAWQEYTVGIWARMNEKQGWVEMLSAQRGRQPTLKSK